MTWAEFRIRSHAYKRQEKKKLLMLRELAWVTYIAPYQNPKKMAKTKESFWALDKKSNVIPDSVKGRILEAQKEYFKQLEENG